MSDYTDMRGRGGLVIIAWGSADGVFSARFADTEITALNEARELVAAAELERAARAWRLISWTQPPLMDRIAVYTFPLDERITHELARELAMSWIKLNSASRLMEFALYPVDLPPIWELNPSVPWKSQSMIGQARVLLRMSIPS